MNLYLITSDLTNYDTYESAVVVAPDAGTARRIHPSDGGVLGAPDFRSPAFNAWGERWDVFKKEVEKYPNGPDGTWPDPDYVEVKFIGKAVDDEPKVICASFCAGS